MSFIPEETVTISNTGRGIVLVRAVTELIAGIPVVTQPKIQELGPGESTVIFLHPHTQISVLPKTVELKQTIVDRPEYHKK